MLLQTKKERIDKKNERESAKMEGGGNGYKKYSHHHLLEPIHLVLHILSKFAKLP